MELVAIYTHFLALFFYEVQELSAKQCIMDIAAEVSYLEMSLKAA